MRLTPSLWRKSNSSNLLAYIREWNATPMSGGRPYAEHLIRVGISPEAGIWSIRKSQGLRERIQNLVMSLGVLFWKSCSIKPLCSLRCRQSFARMSINFRRSSSMSSASLKSSLDAPQYPKPNRAPHKVESCFSKAFNIGRYRGRDMG